LAEMDADTVMEQLLAAIGEDVALPQQRSSFSPGELEDQVMVVESGEVNISSTVSQSNHVTLTASR